MANLNQIMDYLADNQVYYKDVSGTTGTSAYQSWYYTDIALDLPTGSKVLGFSVLTAGSNRPVFTILISSTHVRAYSNVASTPVTIRVLYR